MKQNHNIENCHDLTANEQYLYSSEDDDISSSDDMDQSCLPEKFRIEIPEPSTAVDFESFVLYKYGRDYLKAKRLVEDRDEEKQYSDGISNLQVKNWLDLETIIFRLRQYFMLVINSHNIYR